MDAKALLDSLDLGVAVVAPDLTIEDWSAAAERITRIPAASAVGRPPDDVFGVPGTEGICAVLRQVQADHRPRTCVIPPGALPLSDRSLEAEVSHGPAGRLVLVLQQVATPANRAARATTLMTGLDAERHLYGKVFHALPIAAIVVTQFCQIVEANAEAARLLGVPTAELLVEKPLSDWVSPGERPALAAALHDSALSQRQVELTLQAPGRIPAAIHAVIVDVTPLGDQRKSLFLAFDASRETRLQQRLVQSERLSLLGRLLSGMARELNSPLAAMAAFADIVLHDAHSPAVQESAGVIATESVRAVRIVDTVLEFAQQRPRVREAVDVLDVVNRVLSLQRSALTRARARVNVKMPSHLPWVIGDAQELYQIVLSGVMNARQAISATGQEGEITISARAGEGRMLVEIEDTGPGLPPGAETRVFEPFFTTKGDAGSGLGLAISFGLVRAMGGRMWIESIPGKGARLSFEVPLDVSDRPAPDLLASLPAAVERADAPKPLRVLVIENEENVRRGLTLLTKRLGHDVMSVASYVEASRRLADPGAGFDAFLVDVHLDEGHSGFELFNQLREEGRGREGLLVFTSGDSLSPDTVSQLERSGRPVLRKPFGMDELSRTLTSVKRA